MAPEDLIYVGVHNRRTDHLQYQAEGGWREIQPGYFLEALEVYRQWSWQSDKHPVFLFVSDDLDWARQKLLPRIKTKGEGSSMEPWGHLKIYQKIQNKTLKIYPNPLSWKSPQRIYSYEP